MRLGWGTWALVLATSLAPAATAQAATIYASDVGGAFDITYEGDPHEANRITLTQDPVTAQYVVTDLGSGRITLSTWSFNQAAERCTIEPRRVACAAEPGLGVHVRLRGHDRDDRITVRIPEPTATIGTFLIGDAGDDVLENDLGESPSTGYPYGSALTGGDGDDVLLGGEQGEGFTGGPGADHIVGGGGVDSNDFWRHATTGVHATLDGVANDGPPGEGDNLDPTIEQVTGTPFDDVLIGGPGAQLLDGDKGNDRLVGGPGADDLWGANGDDVIEARDGEADRIECGAGADTVSLDATDLTNTAWLYPGRLDCETLQPGL